MNNILALQLFDAVENDIQVSGITCFPESRWREAILYYLFGVWADRENVMYRPKIMFGGITFRLDTKAREYFAYGKPREKLYPLSFREEERLVIGFKQVEVEQGLIRFVKNDRIKQLTISLPDSARLELWKKQRRGQYGVTAYGIPPLGEV